MKCFSTQTTPLFRVNLISIFCVNLSPVSFTFLITAPFLDLYYSQFCLFWTLTPKKTPGALEAIFILSHLSKFQTTFASLLSYYFLTLYNSLKRNNCWDLGLCFCFFPGFNSSTIKAVWLWNTVTNSANALASLQAILCQCCTYCVEQQMQ